MRVLALESSCDETAVALYDAKQHRCVEKIYSQIALHQPYGGVVPELASRDHAIKILPLVRSLCEEASLSLSDIDGVAYTSGPGLRGALMVGAALGRSLAYAIDCPAIAVHHLEGHILAPMLSENPPPFPFLALLVSGGHSQLIASRALGKYELLGESLDDAAGEAFDKTAKCLGLPYPGGPALSKLAEPGDPSRFSLPRPLTKERTLSMSFSGLKTAVSQLIQSLEPITKQDKADVAAAFQEAVVDTLIKKVCWALEDSGLSRVVIAGGVGANRQLREKLSLAGTKQGFEVYYPESRLCTDNAAMIAYAGYHRLKAGHTAPLSIQTRARWPLTEMPPI